MVIRPAGSATRDSVSPVTDPRVNAALNFSYRLPDDLCTLINPDSFARHHGDQWNAQCEVSCEPQRVRWNQGDRHVARCLDCAGD